MNQGNLSAAPASAGAALLLLASEPAFSTITGPAAADSFRMFPVA
jgi:hypothetical protein